MDQSTLILIVILSCVALCFLHGLYDYYHQSPLTNETIDRYRHMSIQYVPEIGRYYPCHRGDYIHYWSKVGHYSTHDCITGAVYGETKQEAIREYDDYLEYKETKIQISKVFN